MDYTYEPDVISQLRSAIESKIKDNKYIQMEKLHLQKISENKRIVLEKNIKLFFDQLDIFIKETIHIELKDADEQIEDGKLTIESKPIVFAVLDDERYSTKGFESFNIFLNKMYHDSRFISRKKQLMDLLHIDIEVIHVGDFYEPCLCFFAHIVVV